ncbi:MAG: hypothetical protein HFH45_05670 [Bacilli bacterium]|nr:hypothetical protein [Bacilli bacterium]
MNFKKYFGTYKKSNSKQIINYMNKLDKKISKYYNFGRPFTKGNYDLKYSDYLKDKKLNYNSMSPEETFQQISYLYQNIPNWANPGTMINVIPSVNLVSLAAANVTNSFNSNFAQDTYAGYLIASELEVVKYISDLLGWDYKQSHGIFTFGGKGTNLYATKIALLKADYETKYSGCHNSKYFMITSSNGHPCHYQACDWLGIGMDNCIDVPCDTDGQISVKEAEKIIRENLDVGKIFLGYNLNGGSTNELAIDPIKDIYEMNMRIVKDYKLNYIPHIHVDFVLGWVSLFFKDFDFGTRVDNEALFRIKQLKDKAEEIIYADSVGIDFHKTGFCPYVSSVFVVKNRDDYFLLDKTKTQSLDEMYYGNFNPYNTSLELTRSGNGPIAALSCLKSLGIHGFQEIFISLFESVAYFRNQLSKNKKICLINNDSLGLATFFILKPEEYMDMSIDEIIKLPEKDINKIKEFNVNFGKYILEKGKNGLIDFTFTSSRSYKYPGTDIKIGALKMYPMSVFLTKKEAYRLIKNIENCIDKFYLEDIGNINSNYIDDDMVYKERKNKNV